MPKSLYDVHPGVAMIQKWEAELPKKTGHSLEEWIVLVQETGPQSAKERREWLKTEHKLNTYSTVWIVARAEGDEEMSNPDAYLKGAEKHIEEMYGGKKSGLRPLHDALYKLCKSLGRDVRCCPCQTIVPFYRKHVFAQIKPSTLTRIDFGLALGATKASGRLLSTGGFAKKDRITHRFEIATVKDINADVKRWLKKAYALDA